METENKPCEAQGKLQVVKTETPLSPRYPETASTVLAAQAKAQIEARYVMAERHPRDLDVVREKLLQECKRPGFAAVARYLKPIGRGVEGPSIRFAETTIRLMGNISVDQMTVYDDREKRIVRVIVVDCETNTPYSSDITVEKTVERRSVKDGDEVLRTRTNSKGQMVHVIAATEDDLLNKQNALISKAIRNNGLRLIPGDIVEECMTQVLATQANEDASDPQQGRKKIFDAFGGLGISVGQLKDYLGHEAEALDAKETSDLRGLYAALREGELTWRQVLEAKERSAPETPAPPFEAQGQKSATAAVKEHLSKSQEKRSAAQTGEIWPTLRGSRPETASGKDEPKDAA